MQSESDLPDSSSDRPHYLLQAIRSDLYIRLASLVFFALVARVITLCPKLEVVDINKPTWKVMEHARLFTMWRRFSKDNETVPEMEDACLCCFISCTRQCLCHCAARSVLNVPSEVTRCKYKTTEIWSEQSDLNGFAEMLIVFGYLTLSWTADLNIAFALFPSSICCSRKLQNNIMFQASYNWPWLDLIN